MYSMLQRQSFSSVNPLQQLDRDSVRRQEKFRLAVPAPANDSPAVDMRIATAAFTMGTSEDATPNGKRRRQPATPAETFQSGPGPPHVCAPLAAGANPAPLHPRARHGAEYRIQPDPRRVDPRRQ